MKTVFVVNPKAGQGKDIDKLIKKIDVISYKLGYDVIIYRTKCVGDAANFVKNYCTRFGSARFIACGGDGTLSEVINGAIGFDDAQVGVIPTGTGNDFQRNFECDFFDNIEFQITGETAKCDAICYKTYFDGIEKNGYALNMFNIGFDCNVVDMTASMKKKPFISGHFAYLLSVFAILIKKKGENLKIEIDGKCVHNGKLLLMSIANGKYCGGGMKSNPLSSVNDGRMDVNIINNVSRMKLLTLLPRYMKGTHLKIKNIGKIISNIKAKQIIVTPNNSKMRLCIDGEIIDAEKTQFEILHNALNFVIPIKKETKVLEKQV